MINNLLLVKERKENAGSGFIVPRHPEFVFIRELSVNSWQAKNKKTREVVTIRKTAKDNFIYFKFL